MKNVYKGRLLKVFVKTRKLPNGYTATFEMIKHPGAALIVPFLSKDRIIMLRQLRPVINSYIYEFPAGTLDKNEAPIACARREIVEEAGFSAGKLTLAGKIYPVPGYSTEKIFIYKAEGLKKVEHIKEKDEVIEVHTFTRRSLVRLLNKGAITDGKTIAAIALCGLL